MDITGVIEIINTVGFPIACVVAMYFMLDKERKDHKEETDKMIQALNNNTIVLEQIRAVLIKGGVIDG